MKEMRTTTTSISTCSG